MGNLKRSTPLISKRKIVSAINLYEKHVDESIKSIRIWSSTTYQFNGINNNYFVDIANNKVSKSYPDPEY